jgi:IS30 family transposase
MGHLENTTKKRTWKQITEKERYQIEVLIQLGLSPVEISKQLKRDRRTIEREIAKGSVVQVDSQWKERKQYCADVGQRITRERAANKGRPLKIGNDHKLAEYIEEKIGKDKYSPDAVIGRIKAEGIIFKTSICTKTVYNYIDK